MTDRSTSHATFVIERDYAASPARVFNAFADPAAKAKWFGGPPEWEKRDQEFDFRIGGREHLNGGPKGGPAHIFDAEYRDIVPNERIIYVYSMSLDERRISVSIATVELKAIGKGTRLTFTEQGVFLDGYDDAGQREHGSRWLLDKLAAAVEADSTRGS
jgi:uncharacterized protein YndB with AHSA1/START domain